MSKEIQTDYINAKTLYAIIRNSVGQVWQTTSSTFVTYVTANIANYTISLTEQGTASGYYSGDMPAIAANFLNIIVKEKLGASAAESDPTIAAGQIDWSGTVVVRNYLDSEIATAVNNSTWITANINLIRNAITGGAYAFSTDSNGRIRIVDGTSAGELDTLSGNLVQVNQLGTQAKVDVYTQILQSLTGDNYVEPVQGTPVATTTLAAKINYIYKFLINKITQTSTTLNIFDNAGSTVDHKSTVSDDGTTYTRTKIVSGP